MCVRDSSPISLTEKKWWLNKGELLFLNQFTKHEILNAGEEDIAINFMMLPEFFDVAYSMAGNNNMLADFLVNVLRQDEERGEYLHFKVAEVCRSRIFWKISSILW